jgi:pimeloyl-ACP methyl ester carboxylesterase
MPMLDVNDTSLYYVDTGPGSTGETIAFSHGLLWATEQFEPQIATLRARYRCIAWDHRGQGRSAPDHRECIGVELVWHDAVALIERLGVGPVHFVGLSMGGFVAMRLAARRPDLLRSLVLLETSADPEPLANIRRYRMLNAVTRWVGMRVVAPRVAPIMLGKTVLADPKRRADVARYVAIMTRRKDIWRAVNGVIDRAGVYEELARIRAPTLIVVGDEDVATPRPNAERIAGAIRHARLEVVAGAGHSSPVEQPEAITTMLEQFLAQQRGVSHAV